MTTLRRRSDWVLAVTVIEMVDDGTKPLRAAAARAAVRAAASSGSQTTPASAAASAARRMSEVRLYQWPTSTARPAISSSGTSRRANMTMT